MANEGQKVGSVQNENISSILSQQFAFYSRYANDLINDLENNRNLYQQRPNMKSQGVGTDNIMYDEPEYDEDGNPLTSKKSTMFGGKGAFNNSGTKDYTSDPTADDRGLGDIENKEIFETEET